MCLQSVKWVEKAMRQLAICIGMRETCSKAISMLEARQVGAGDSLLRTGIMKCSCPSQVFTKGLLLYYLNLEVRHLSHLLVVGAQDFVFEPTFGLCPVSYGAVN